MKINWFVDTPITAQYFEVEIDQDGIVWIKTSYTQNEFIALHKEML